MTHDAPQLEIFTTRSGALSARVIGADFVRHLHSTVDPQAEERYFLDLELWGDAIIFAGFGLGYHVRRKLKDLAPGKTLIFIEYYEELLDRFRDLFPGARDDAKLFLSSVDRTEGEGLVRQALQCPHPRGIQIVKHPASYSANRPFYDSVLSVIVSRQERGSGTQGSKCLLLYGNFFLQEEMRRAIHGQTGCEPALLRYDTITSSPRYESELSKALRTHNPDYLLSVNMQGFDGNGVLGEITGRLGIPVVVWFVDDPHPILLQQHQFIGDHMIALTWERAYMPFLRTRGFGQVEYLPLATDPEMMAAGIGSVSPTPVGFVGSSMGGEFLREIRRKFLWSDALTPLVERAAGELLKKPAANVPDLIAAIAADLGMPVPFSDRRNTTWFCSYVIHSASAIKRRDTVRDLLPLGIHTFGDSQGWREALGPSVPVNPDIDYRSGIGAVYRSIDVNVNITSCQMSNAVNQRVFDIPAAGGFALSDSQGDLFELLSPGEEFVSYSGLDELKEKTTFFAGHEQERRKIIEAARRRILNEHTYRHRVREIARVLGRG